MGSRMVMGNSAGEGDHQLEATSFDKESANPTAKIKLVPLFSGEFENARKVGCVRAVEELRQMPDVVLHDVRRRDTSSS